LEKIGKNLEIWERKRKGSKKRICVKKDEEIRVEKG